MRTSSANQQPQCLGDADVHGRGRPVDGPGFILGRVGGWLEDARVNHAEFFRDGVPECKQPVPPGHSERLPAEREAAVLLVVHLDDLEVLKVMPGGAADARAVRIHGNLPIFPLGWPQSPLRTG
jgi:hypothetical protein